MMCPHCNEAELKVVKGDEPWTVDHLQCPECDSTFPIEEEAL